MIKNNWGLLLVLLVISSLFYISLSYLPATTFAQYPAPTAEPNPAIDRVYFPIMFSNWKYVYYPWRAILSSYVSQDAAGRYGLSYVYHSGSTIDSGVTYITGTFQFGYQEHPHTSSGLIYFATRPNPSNICKLDEPGGTCVSNIIDIPYHSTPETRRIDFVHNPNPPPPTATPTNTPIPSATPTYPPSRTPRPTETRPTPSPTRIQSPYPTPTPIICPILPRYGPSGASEWCFDPPDTFFVRTNMMSIYSYIEIDSALVPQCPGADHVYYQIVHPDRQASPCSFFEDDLTGGEQTSLPLYNYYNYDYYHYSGWQVWIFKQDGEFLRVAYPQYPID